MGRIRILILILLVSAATSSAARADAQSLNGVALVIGEGKYPDKLPNPKRDAKAMDDLFDRLHFDTTPVLDASRDQLTDAMDDFVTCLLYTSPSPRD